MPRVPVYEAPTVQPTSLPSAYQQVPSSMDDYMMVRAKQGQEIGEGLRKVANAVSAFEEKERIERVEADTKSASASFTALGTSVLYDEKNGYTYKQGNNALGEVKDKAIDDLRKGFDKTVESLTDPRARRLFVMSAQPQLNAFLSQVESHAGQAHQTYQLTASNDRIAVAGNTASRSFNVDVLANPSAGNPVYDTQIQTARAELMDQGQNLLGLSGEELTSFVKDGMGKIYLATAKHLADTGKGAAAKQYLQEHADVIPNTAALDEVRKTVDGSADADEALTLALTLTGTPAEQRAQLNQRFLDKRINARTYQLASQQVDQNEADHERELTQQANWALGQAQQWLVNNPTASVTQVPRQYLNIISDRGRLGDLLAFATNGNRFVTDAETWTKVNTMTKEQLAAYTPESFAEEFRGRLDDGHLNAGIALVKKARGEPLDADGTQLTSNSEYLKQTAVRAGILPATGDGTPAQRTAFLNFTNEAQRLVRQFELTKLKGERRASRDELEKVVDGMLLNKVFLNKTGVDPEVPIGTLDIAHMSNDDLKDVYVTVKGKDISLIDIPGDKRKQIIAGLERDGEEPTEQAIAEVWVSMRKSK